MIYADNAATTELDKDAFDAMCPFLLENYGNASQPYFFAINAKKAIKDARERIANCIGAEPEEIFFTSCGTESDNWAIKMGAGKGGDIVTSVIEHHAILNSCVTLERQGRNIIYVPVTRDGEIDSDCFVRYITKNTKIISIMFANNEIGTIQPIKEIGTIARENNIYFHTDSVQAVGSIKIDVKEMNIDSLSMSAHKFYGPKGVGALYIKKGIAFQKFMNGGHQERNKRAGTENIPAIVGMGKAIEIAYSDLEKHTKQIKDLRDYYINQVKDKIPYIKINGDMEKRLPGNSNISFRFIEGEGLLLNLDLKGICASSGSACTSGSLDPSHVLLAIGLPHEIAHGSLRISIGKYNTKEEIDYVVESLVEIVGRLREMSPLYEKFIEEENK